jgi:hypothetical protein
MCRPFAVVHVLALVLAVTLTGNVRPVRADYCGSFCPGGVCTDGGSPCCCDPIHQKGSCCVGGSCCTTSSGAVECVYPCRGGMVEQDCNCVCPSGTVYCGGNCVAACLSGEVLGPDCGCVSQCPSGTTSCGGHCVQQCAPPLVPTGPFFCRCILPCAQGSTQCGSACCPPGKECADPLFSLCCPAGKSCGDSCLVKGFTKLFPCCKRGPASAGGYSVEKATTICCVGPDSFCDKATQRCRKPRGSTVRRCVPKTP